MSVGALLGPTGEPSHGQASAAAAPDVAGAPDGRTTIPGPPSMILATWMPPEPATSVTDVVIVCREPLV